MEGYFEKYLLESGGTINPQRDKMIQDIVNIKIKIKKLRDALNKLTINEIEKKRYELKKMIEKLEREFNVTSRKLRHDITNEENNDDGDYKISI